MPKDNNVAIEIVVNPTNGGKSVFADESFPSLSNLSAFRSDKARSIEVARKLVNNGFRIQNVGEFSISATCPSGKFEEFFGTTICEIKRPDNSRVPENYRLHAPLLGTPFTLPERDKLDKLIDRVYIQHPPIFFADERPIPPFWNDKFRLKVPTDVAQLMNASSVHRRGITGKGVKVVMTDTGFYHHPYYQAQGYKFLSISAPDTFDHTSDSNGHGTGELANLFAVAPGINFIGVKINNPTLAIKTASDLRPDVMSNSWGYSEDLPESTMPNWLRPLYLAVLDAVSRGITMCFSAGNGHYGFPGSMPEVISVGGVVVDEDLNYSATPYASGFASTWFPGRNTPDVTGLCGMPPSADYIVLPVESGAQLEHANGWGRFSGTSAASPMVAGVCALLKEADPSLTPSDIKNILKFTARDIVRGTNAHGHKASPGPDEATGYGLVDGARALGSAM